MNDALVATSGDTYTSRAYLTTLLSYGRDAKETWLNRLEVWCMDEDGKCDAQDNTALLKHSAWIRRLGVRVPLSSRHFLSQKLWHFHKNIRSCVENEWCCPRTVNISNVNLTSKLSIPKLEGRFQLPVPVAFQHGANKCLFTLLHALNMLWVY